MTTSTEQYAEIVKQSQEAVRTAVDTWARTVQDALGQLPAVSPVQADEVIDQIYDFAGKLLAAQRDFAKQLVATGTAAVESVRNGTAKATEAAHQG